MKTEVKTNKKTKKPISKKTKNVKKNGSEQKKRNTKLKRKVVSIISLGIALCIIVVLILFSDLFNITKITVINNQKVSSEEVIKKSSLVVGNNMFKTFNYISKNNIMTNPYIEEVKINKKFNGEVVIDVTERIATYMLQKESHYIYINNQGYMLEKSKIPLELPTIIGYSTTDINPGNRMNVEDLKKLDTIIHIMETAKNNGINNMITSIDIADENNFILYIPSEGKTVQFGDKTNINVKVLWIVDLISREKGIEGEIIVNVPDIKKVYFREKV